MPLALIDGDIAAYRAASVKVAGIEDEDGTPGPLDYLHPVTAAGVACRTVTEWMQAAGCDECIVAFSGDHNWRRRVMPSYKDNRKGVPKPIHLGTVRRTVCERFPHRVVDGLEADDVLGILATREKYAGAIIVSPDKDMRTIPGAHFSPIKDEFYGIVPAEADYYWMLQTLMGDSSDGYTGIPGVGEKKAKAILKGCLTLDAMWRNVLGAYRKAGLTEAFALQTARIAGILHDSDYDVKTKEILLWTGPRSTPERLPLLPAAATTTASPVRATSATATPPSNS